MPGLQARGREDSSTDESMGSMPGLQPRGRDDSSTDEDDDWFGDDADSDDDANVHGRGGMNHPQIPWMINNHYRFDINHNTAGDTNHATAIPLPLWPIVLARASEQPRFVNRLWDTRSGLYTMLRRGPLFLNNTSNKRTSNSP